LELPLITSERNQQSHQAEYRTFDSPAAGLNRFRVAGELAEVYPGPSFQHHEYPQKHSKDGEKS
jgi:hypothetical protein